MRPEESLLANVKMAPRDAILGLAETYVADPNPKKVNLGVGVYYDDQGKVPLLECVRRADEALTAAGIARPYLAMDGFPDFVRAVQTLLFGADHPAVAQGRVTTVQAVGGTGGLKVGADFIRRFAPEAVLYMSDPSYDNHRPLFEEAGFRVETYPYYDPRTRGIRFAEMIEFLRGVPKGSVALLHACCHNPTGVDIRSKQWDEVIKIVAERRLIPFLDFAYQGFGDGIEEDAQVARRFAEALPVVLVAMSFSKSFSLYGERVGSLSVVTADSGGLRLHSAAARDLLVLGPVARADGRDARALLGIRHRVWPHLRRGPELAQPRLRRRRDRGHGAYQRGRTLHAARRGLRPPGRRGRRIMLPSARGSAWPSS